MSQQTEIYNFEGKPAGKIALPSGVFDTKLNKPLIAQAARIFLSNQRKAQAHAKTRSEVTASTKKIYRQKGTGRARHGDVKAPVFVGGGKAHGPTGEQNYKMTLPGKMIKLVLKSILSEKLKDGQIFFVESLDKTEGKTRLMSNLIKSLPIEEKNRSNYLLVLKERDEKISKSARNIVGMSITQVNNLSPYQVLSKKTIIFSKEALSFFK